MQNLNEIIKNSTIPYTVVFITTALILLGLIIVLWLDVYIQKDKKNTILISILLAGSLMLQNLFEYILVTGMPNPKLRTAVGVYGYIVRPITILFLFRIIGSIKGRRFSVILIIFNTVVFLTAFFSPIAFYITDDNIFERGPLGYTCHIVSYILLVANLYIIIRTSEKSRLRHTIIPMFNTAVIFGAIIYEDLTMSKMDLPITPLTIAIVLNCVFYYFWLHMQFVREHEKDITAQQRIRTMVSQMQPHFIYNSLTVIGSYLDEPKKAEEALSNFSGFLRGSINLLNSTECISALKEFETVDHYLYLEKERFGDKLNVVRDIKDFDFLLPAFTVQSLIDNAINHGIRNTKDGRGTLWLRSYITTKAHVIEVEDDGVGFSFDKYEVVTPDADERTHIGLKNVKERLELMCNGTITVNTAVGRGTKVIVKIPIN